MVRTIDFAELENKMRLTVVVITSDTLRVLSQLTRCVQVKVWQPCTLKLENKMRVIEVIKYDT